jgi:hypothetical protein
MNLRKIDLSELDHVAKLLVEQCPGRDLEEAKEHTEWHLKGFPEFCLAAEEDGEIIGFVISHLHENALEIEELYAAKGREDAWKPLINEVLNRIPKVDTVTMDVDGFKELISQLK